MDTDYRLFAQPAGTVEGNILVCFHKDFLDAYHTASDRPGPDVTLVVLINAFDGVDGDGIHIARCMHDG